MAGLNSFLSIVVYDDLKRDDLVRAYSVFLYLALSVPPSSGLVGLLTYFRTYREGSRGVVRSLIRGGRVGGGPSDLEEQPAGSMFPMYTCPADWLLVLPFAVFPLSILS